MIKIWFPSKEDTEAAAEGLSDFGRPEHLERIETVHGETEYLALTCKEARERLEELSESMEGEENFARRLAEALSITRSLFESSDYEKILACETRKAAEKRLYEVVDGPADLEELSERVERSMEEALEGAPEEGERETEFPEEFPDDFGEYSFSKSFLVNPVLDSVLEHGEKDDPLKAFTQDVHLDVTPVSERFDDAEKKIDLDARVIYGLKLGIEQVLHFEEVMDSLEGRRPVSSSEEVSYRFLTLRMIADEILSAVRGRKKAGYDEFVDEVVDRMNTMVRGEEAEKAFPHATREAVESIVRKLKRAGYTRKKAKPSRRRTRTVRPRFLSFRLTLNTGCRTGLFMGKLAFRPSFETPTRGDKESVDPPRERPPNISSMLTEMHQKTRLDSVITE